MMFSKPGEIPEVLTDGSVHRLRFTLTESELTAVVDYVREARRRP